MDAVHSAKKRFVCPVCDKKFPYENSLKMHMMLHTNDRWVAVTSMSLKKYCIFFKLYKSVKSKALFTYTDIQPDIFTLYTARYCVNEQRAECVVNPNQTETSSAQYGDIILPLQCQ